MIHLPPLFSVIVPVYKAENFLHTCVDSILTQSFSDYELILVDDGSPDNSGAICDAYAAKDARIRVIHQENKGNVLARRAGQTISRGIYLVHVDSDDYVAADFLQQVADQIQAHSADAVLFGFIRFSDMQQTSFPQRIPAGIYQKENLPLFQDRLIFHESGAVSYGLCSLVMKRSILLPYLDAVPSALYKGEDLAASAPALASCKRVSVLDSCPYYYRDNPSSIMNSFSEKEAEQIELAAKHLLRVMPPAYEEKIYHFVLNRYFDLLDRGILKSYREYRTLIRHTESDTLLNLLRKARCKAGLRMKLLYFLMQHRCYTALWLLRKLRKRSTE